MRKVLYFIQVPPPVHGVSTINKYVLESEIINENIEKKLLEIKFSDSIDELTHFSFAKFFKFVKLFFRLLKSLFKFKPNFVYFSIMPVGKGFYRDFIYVLLMKMFRAKIIFHLHNSGINDKKHGFFKSKMYHWVFDNSFIIHLSDGLLEKEISPLNLKNTKVFAVSNGVEENTHIFDRISHNHIINLLFVSNLFPEKGLMVLLNAFLMVFQKHKNIHLHIVGSTPNNRYKTEVLEFILNHGLHEHVTIHDFANELEKAKLYTNSDIFVFPTLNDTWGLVNLEAMQFSLPIISTFEGAIPEYIQNGENGVLVEKNNIEQLSEKINLLIENENLRKEIGQKGRENYQKNYTKLSFENNMKKTFNEIMLNN